MENFTATNLIRVGNFLKSIGFGNIPLSGNIQLRLDDYLMMTEKLCELGMWERGDNFESLDNIPISYEWNKEEKIDERSKN